MNACEKETKLVGHFVHMHRRINPAAYANGTRKLGADFPTPEVEMFYWSCSFPSPSSFFFFFQQTRFECN